MRKIKYVTVVAIVVISGVIGFMSMKKNSPKTGLSGLALANVEALSTAKEAYQLITCYEKVNPDRNSSFAYLECYSKTDKDLIYSCSGAKTIRGTLALLVNTYNCVQ